MVVVGGGIGAEVVSASWEQSKGQRSSIHMKTPTKLTQKKILVWVAGWEVRTGVEKWL